ncbi:MAG: TonB-dependent receptor [Bacteroidota bacterium]|nr:TonB-dependent receptor [Bacteroidota bacterium]
MRKLFMLLISAVFLNATIQAQKISGIVKDEMGKGLEKTTVTLLRAKDSATVKLNATDKNGNYVFNAINPGSYLVKVTHVGYSPRYSKPLAVTAGTDFTVPEMTMVKAEGVLQGVTVSSEKPMVEVKADKMVVNVEGTINAVGNDALELLRKSPGVLIDKDDNISLSGKNGVQIYVDGKPTPLSGADLSAYLKSLQSAQIESIEIITNPSAKYDAAGNAGIINIRLKKNKSFGTNGSFNAGYGIGTYGKYNAGLALNYRNKKVNLFGNYNFNHSFNTNTFTLYRDVADSIFDGNNVLTNKSTSHGFKGGLDYFVSKKSTLGFVINGNVSDNDIKTTGLTNIIYKPTMVTDRLLQGDNTNKSNRSNVNFNVNYRYADTAGRELNVDADYGLFRSKSDQLQPNIYYHPGDPNALNSEIFSFLSPSNIDIYTVKADYEQNYKKGKLGVGFKTSITKTDNNFGSYDVVGNAKNLDVTKSNQFNYKENINAAYVNYNKQLKGVMLQAGVRVENTTSTGDSYGLNADGSVNYSSKQQFKRQYTDPFPSASLTFNKNPMKQWGISYSRRIDRPAYQDLNPFLFKLNVYTFQKGNTELLPQYTNSFSINNVYKYKLTTTLTYSHVNDVFTQLVDTTEISKAFITKRNLAKQDIASLNVSYPFMYKSYMLFANLNTYYSLYKADFGGGTRKVNVDVFSYNLYMQNSLKFGGKKKAWTAELSGFYTAPSVWQGTFKSKALWSIDGGLQKVIFKGKGNLKASVSDIFGTLRWKGTSVFADQTTIATGHWESRQFKLNLTWRFGSNLVKAARQRKLGTEEELNRTQSSGGIGGN